jgi:hypothetical protein
MIDPNDLEPDLRVLLDDAKGRDAVDPAFGEAARERVLARVEAAIRAPSAAPRGFFGRRSLVMLASVGLLAIVAGSVILGGRDVHAPTTLATPPVVESPAASAPPVAEEVPSIHVDDLPSSASVPAPSAPARALSRAAASASAAPGTRLAEEYRLVEDARAKLAAKDYGGASRSIRAHDESFPAGQLNQECESLHIQLLVETGRVAEARERAQAFRARFPNGLLAPSVARAIASSDSATP